MGSPASGEWKPHPRASAGTPAYTGSITSVFVLVAVFIVVLSSIGIWMFFLNPRMNLAPVTKPTVSFQAVEKTNSKAWKIILSDVTPGNAGISKYALRVMVNSSVAIDNNAISSHNPQGTYDDGFNILTLNFYDIASNGILNTGDYFTFRFSNVPSAGLTIEFKLLWNDDGSVLTSDGFIT
jgi:hypothetical protein